MVIGGGAAGYFAAIACAETNARQPVILLEQARQPLGKVRISGGGRCNVTHACFDPKALVAFYPRGAKALLGPFTRFGPKDTVAWFERRGVPLKTEPDGRMFPKTDSSQSIIDALTRAARDAGVNVRMQADVAEIAATDGGYRLTAGTGEALFARKLLLATGSGRRGWEWATALGHTVVPPVPSLFTFHIEDKRLKGLEGVSVPKGTIRVPGTKLKQTGPILITHHGLSGPAVLKLSAWGARAFHDFGYEIDISIDWIGWKRDAVEQGLRDLKLEYPKRWVASLPAFGTPRRLWERLLSCAHIREKQMWTDLTRDQMDRITEALINGTYRVSGKSPFKEEFVTCGGVALDEVNFRTMESRRSPGLYFAGEILDIDAVTGGFNFQNAWTTGRLAGQAMGVSGGTS